MFFSKRTQPSRPHAKRTVAITGLLVLSTAACIGDEDAPECFFPDGMGGCLTPPILDITIACDTIPTGAMRATYGYTADVSGGSGSCDDQGLCSGYLWEATGLPMGLALDVNTGRISGVPEEQGTFPVTITASDTKFAGQSTASCDLVVNEALNVDRLRDEARHCLQIGQDVNDFVDGGDGSAFECNFRDRDPTMDPCPYGDGNGVLPDGILMNTDGGQCSHSGTITETAFGTWVWMVEMTQSDYTIHVPFCASQETPGQHDLTVTYSGASTNDGLEPALVEFTPGVNSSFGGGQDPFFEALGGSLCNGGGCNFFGFNFAVTCSPLDPPFSLEPGQKIQDMTGNDLGFSHEMTADFPAVSAAFEERPWVANWTIDYCNSATGGDCMDAAISTNAQTTLNYSVIGWPAAN